MGGDHKCPLCDATFTRPQHVGRHLRAHTGDRPYECKICPLRFARSDLLSRHVNKAHKSPDPNEPAKKGAKRGRRKSLPSSRQPALTTTAVAETAPPPHVAEKPRRSSFADADAHRRQQAASQLQAEQMYPHHPLLSGATVPSLVGNLANEGWNGPGVLTLPGPGGSTSASAGPSSIDPFTAVGNATASLPVTATQTPIMVNSSVSPQSELYNLPSTSGHVALPMRTTGSEQGFVSPDRWRNSFGFVPGWEWGYKKRACDQCNHSKVRCDTGEPCQRCSNRNLACTYNKPQKSRSIGNFGQRMSATMSSSGSGMSSSPSSSSYSPYQTTLQPAGVAPPLHTMSDARRMTFPMSNEFSPQTSTFMQAQVQPSLQSWSMAPQVSNINPALLPGNQPEEVSPMGHGVPLRLERPRLRPNPEHSTSMGESASSSSIVQATPALTASYSSTSPPSSEGHRDRSGSQNGTTMPNLIFSSGGGLQKSLVGTDSQMAWDQNNSAMVSASPMTFATSSLDTVSTDTSTASVPWPSSSASGTMDPRLQYRGSLTMDDDTHSMPGTVRSTYLELEDAKRAIDHRRRSSAGTWANALNDLSLQDGAAAAAVAATAGMDMSIPFVASQVAQAIQARRPSFPTFPLSSANSSLQAEMSKPQSFGDAKDLWKLFMSEPMTGATPSKEGFDSLDAAYRQMTPRPAMGKRNTSTLSKRNSMPDLMTPSLAQAQANHWNTFAQQDATPGGNGPAHTDVNGVDEQWKSAIQQRHMSFDMAPGDKVGGRPAIDSKTAFLQSLGSRPLPAIFQSSALQQTLAPERTPSFITPVFDAQTPPVPSKLRQSQPHAKHVGSASARPGNKRLASQTLVPDGAKKRDSVVEDTWTDATVSAAVPNSATGPPAHGQQQRWIEPFASSFPAQAAVPGGAGSASLPSKHNPASMMSSAVTMGQSTWPPSTATGLRQVSRAA